MTNKEWVNLISKEFNCSNTMAKDMLHAMYQAREILIVNKDAQRKENQDKSFIEYCEQCDSDDNDFMNNMM